MRAIHLLPLAIITLSGCASPLADRAAFQIRTNYAPVVQVIERTVTNVVERPVTNVVHELVPGTAMTNVIERTNVVMVPVIERTTNTVTVTNQVPVSVEVSPRESLKAGIGAAGSLLGPWGTFAGVAITGLLGVWARARERKINAALSQKAEAHADANVVLAESVEVARELLKATPQGQAVESAYLNWLQSHQRAAGVVDLVADVVDEHVDSRAAKGFAQLIRPPSA